MQPGERRRLRNNGVAAGSAWENRIKLDQVKGGLKVFNDSDNEEQAKPDIEGVKLHAKPQINSQISNNNVEKRKRRIWKPADPALINEVIDKNLVQLRKSNSELLDFKSHELEEDRIAIENEIKDFDDKEIDLPVENKEFKKSNGVEKISCLQKSEELDLNEGPDEFIDVESEFSSSRLQNIVDILMWKNISKSAFVFGFGSFVLVSSSYTRDLNFSFILVLSYFALAYLFYKFILNRGMAESIYQEDKCIIEENEAVKILKSLLPYINEVLFNLRTLFSGDSATTIKLAILLFVMARYGNYITIWTLTKIAFFGIFTVPKAVSSYHDQLVTYGKIWFERFKSGWYSCTHKKVVAAVIFAIIWSLSSTVAKIWALFMMVVAAKYYQQNTVKGSAQGGNISKKQEMEKECSKAESSPSNINKVKFVHRQRSGPKETVKVKKGT